MRARARKLARPEVTAAELALDLGRYRKQVDAIDTALVALLNQRASLALLINDIKERLGLEVHQPGRERAILERLRRENRGPLGGVELEEIYRVIFQESRRIQHRRRRG